MSVVISSVTPGSPAEKAGLHGGDTLISINDNEIVDVLDYRFYQDVTRPVLKYIDENGKLTGLVTIKDIVPRIYL